MSQIPLLLQLLSETCSLPRHAKLTRWGIG